MPPKGISPRALFFKAVYTELKYFAHDLIKQAGPEVVGVTGSVGKSSFIYLLDTVVRDFRKTKTTFHGNSETGLPLELLGIRTLLRDYSLANWLVIMAATPFAYLINRLNYPYEVVIAEMGIDSSQPPKNMGYLLEIVKPDIGVLLAVSAAHSMQFAEELGLDADDEHQIITAIAQEKGRIVTELPAEADAVINLDNEYIKALIPKIAARLTTFGKSKEANLQLRKYVLHEDATEFQFNIEGKAETVTIKDYLLSEEYGLTILAVIASARLLGLAMTDIIDKLENRFTLPNGRSSLLRSQEGARIIDSSYNSSPLALTAMLESLAHYPVKGRRILVLGDMRELGPLAEEAHRDVAKLVAKVGDEIVLVGPLMKQYLSPELEKLGKKPMTFDHAMGVGKRLRQDLKLTPDDVLLVKGSQNTIYLEQVMLEIMEHPETAKDVLARQSPHWDATREAFFKKQPPLH